MPRLSLGGRFKAASSALKRATTSIRVPGLPTRATGSTTTPHRTSTNYCRGIGQPNRPGPQPDVDRVSVR